MSETAVISVEEWQLLSFFGDLPAEREADPWPYTEVVFKVERAGHTLSFALAPAYLDVRIILTHGDAVLYELNAVGIHDVSYSKEGASETLVIDFDGERQLHLSVDPTIRVEERFTRDDAG